MGRSSGLENDLPDIFGGLSQSMCENMDAWKSWMNEKSPHTTNLPGTWGLPYVQKIDVPLKNVENTESETVNQENSSSIGEDEYIGGAQEVESNVPSGLSAFQNY